MDLKRCSKCGEIKSVIEFHERKNNKDGKRYWCKECTAIQRKKYYQENKETLLRYNKKYNQDNKEKIKDYNKNYKQKHKKEIAIQLKKYRKNHLKQHNEYNNQYNKEHPERRKQYQRNKRKIDLRFNLNSRMANAIGYSLKENKAGRHWEDLVGYNVDKLKKHLQKTMPEGYTWQDYLEGRLHIDHKIPKSIFNFTKPEHTDFQHCWELKNLQLLSAKENLKKSNKLMRPFQLGLAL